jgi:hypothetical protein
MNTNSCTALNLFYIHPKIKRERIFLFYENNEEGYEGTHHGSTLGSSQLFGALSKKVSQMRN